MGMSPDHPPGLLLIGRGRFLGVWEIIEFFLLQCFRHGS
jgi:hypothetical protein